MFFFSFIWVIINIVCGKIIEKVLRKLARWTICPALIPLDRYNLKKKSITRFERGMLQQRSVKKNKWFTENGPRKLSWKLYRSTSGECSRERGKLYRIRKRPTTRHPLIYRFPRSTMWSISFPSVVGVIPRCIGVIVSISQDLQFLLISLEDRNARNKPIQVRKF